MLGFFCTKLLSFSELPFGLGSLAFERQRRDRTHGVVHKGQRSVRETLRISTHLWLFGRKEIGASASLKLARSILKRETDVIAARRLHRTQCCVEQDP